MSPSSCASWLAVALGSLLVFGAPTRAAAANLLTNGSFESGPPTGGNSLLLTNGSTGLAPWVVSRGDIDYAGSTYWAAEDGFSSVGLNGTQPGGVAQSFSTVPGGLYRATFWLSGDPVSEPPVVDLRVAAAGASADFHFDTEHVWAWNMSWLQQTWEFNAVAGTTTLELYSLDAGQLGPAIDNVSVELVSLVDVGNASLAGFALSPGAPNPTQGLTRIAYALPRAAHVKLGVYDVSGRLVTVLADQPKPPGSYSVNWDARRDAAPGLYFIRLQAAGHVFTRRLAVTR